MELPTEQEVLFANEAFYEAFADRDARAMGAIWAQRAPVACIHPGWPPLTGRDTVLESWRRILDNPAAPQIRCHDAVVYLQGEAAFVICYEEIEGQFLAATNVFVREGEAWRMVHHTAGPTQGRPRRPGAAGPSRSVN